MIDQNKIFNNIINSMESDARNRIIEILTPQKLLFDNISWRYFIAKVKGSRTWECCWSTTKNKNGKYVSWIYVERKDKWTIEKIVEHKKRKDAKARAYKLYDKRKSN